MQAHQSEETAARPFTNAERVVACDVCGGDRFTDVAPFANIVECAACGYRFVSPRPSQAEVAAAYSDPHFYDGWLAADAGRERMWSKRLDLVRGVAKGKRLLDIGAGIGTFLALARQHAGWSVTGTEVSLSAIELARRRHGLELLHGQAEDLALPGSSFDTITLWHVLEHVPSPSRLLRVCHDALVPGGLLVVAVPNDSDDSRFPFTVKGSVYRLLGREYIPPVRYEPLTPGSEIHLSHFTPAVLVRLLEKEGFRVRRVTADDHYPEPYWRTDLKIQAYRAIARLTGRHLAVALLVFAERV